MPDGTLDAPRAAFDGVDRRAEPPSSAYYTDDSVVTSFVATHCYGLRYTAATGRWSKWTGTKWVDDKTLEIYDEIRKHLRTLARDALADDGLAPSMRDRTANEMRNRKKHVPVEAMARSDRAFAMSVEQWDQDIDLLNTPIGEVDLLTGRLRPNNPKSYCSKSTAVAPGGDCPTWLAFLSDTFGGDQELIAYAQRFCGYCLTGSTIEHAILFCFGAGANGKSTFLNTVFGIMGDYAKVADMAMFTESAYERHPTDLASLQGARCVVASETEANKRWSEAKLKSMTGGDPITARFMRQDPFTFTPQFKALFGGNHKPALYNVDEAMRRRFNLLHFAHTVPAAKRDSRLSAKLRDEWPGILQWMIEGTIEWRARGLCAPASVVAATTEYLDGEDVFGTWLTERTLRNPGLTVAAKPLFEDYKSWCQAGGERFVSLQVFSKELQNRGFERERIASGSIYVGLALKQPGLS